MYDEGVASPEDAQEPYIDTCRQLDGHLIGARLDDDVGDTSKGLRGEVFCSKRLSSLRVQFTLAGRAIQRLIECVRSGLSGLIGGRGVLASGGEPVPQVKADRSQEQHDEDRTERPNRDRAALARVSMTGHG